MARKKSKGSGNRFKNKVAKNVQKQRQATAQYGHLNLPRGVTLFREKPGGRCRLDFLPYEVTDPKHPDRDDDAGVARPGDLWYRRPYFMHRNVGPEGGTAVCPLSVGSMCPVCEYRTKLLREGRDWRDETVQALKARRRNLYVVVPIGDRDYDEAPHIWEISQYLFQDKLNDEIEEDPANEGFPDPEDGLTVRIRFSEEKFGQTTYAETSRIDFEEREEQYGDNILSDVPNLDEVLIIPSYRELESRFFEMEEAGSDDEVADDDNDEEQEEEERPSRRRRGKRAEPSSTRRRSRRGADDDDDDEDEDDRAPHRGRRSAAADDDDQDDQDEEEQDDDDDEQKGKEEPPRHRRTRSGSKKKGRSRKRGDDEDRCPYGYRFGVDTDEYDECDQCEIWEQCLSAKEAAGL